MSTRIIGANNVIYRKYGLYCLAEGDSKPAILCVSCDGVFTNGQEFWAHIKNMHGDDCSSALVLSNNEQHGPLDGVAEMNEQDEWTEVKDLYSPYETPANSSEVGGPAEDFQNGQDSIFISPKDSSEGYKVTQRKQYCSADQLAAVVINEPGTVNLIKQMPVDMHVANECSGETNFSPKNEDTTRPLRRRKTIDVERLPSRQLLNAKILKRILLQMTESNMESKYRWTRLTQELRCLEKGMRRDGSCKSRLTMQVLPDDPYTSRQDVLMLDDDLHRSKEMRDCLHDEVLLIHAKGPESYARFLWNYLMTDEVANQFCWRGVIDGEYVVKYPVKDLTLMSIFQDAFREKFPAQPLNYFKERTVVYFNKALERIKRNQLEKKRSRSGSSTSLLKRNRYESDLEPMDGELPDDVDEEEEYRDEFFLDE